MKKLTIKDKQFMVSIPAVEIQKVVSNMADQLNQDLRDKEVVFLAILNGSFMFAADLIKKITFNCKISFLKLASYAGTSSTGQIKQLIGLNESLKGKTVVVLEDIVDTGTTLESIIRQINSFEPEEMKIATLLLKPEAYHGQHRIDYVGMKIPNRFIVGYGLDYDGYGRNLDSIYETISE
ncbi:MAG: hypoxanthine phosphoribosyltransferase [Bacteroidota bacterium]